MMKRKFGVLWFLSLIAGLVLGYVSFMGTIAAINMVYRSNYRSEHSDVTDPNLKFEEQVLVDNDSYKITVLGINTLSENSYNNELDLRIENKTDGSYTFMARDVKVNGYSVKHSMSEGLKAKETKDTSLAITSKLKDFGIEKISDMEIEFFISDEDTEQYIYDGNYVIQSNYYGSYDQEQEYAKKNIIEIYKDDKFKVSLLDDTSKEMERYSFIFENLTEYELSPSNIKIEVNGTILNDTIYADALRPKSKSLEELKFSFDDTEKKQVGEKLESLRLSFSITLQDKQTYNTVEEYEIPMLKVK